MSAIDYSTLAAQIEQLADSHQDPALADTLRGLAQRVRAISISPEIPADVRITLTREIALEWLQLVALEPALPATLIEQEVSQ